MFESIVSKITKAVRNAVCAVGSGTHHTPWLVPVSILALLFVW